MRLPGQAPAGDPPAGDETENTDAGVPPGTPPEQQTPPDPPPPAPAPVVMPAPAQPPAAAKAPPAPQGGDDDDLGVVEDDDYVLVPKSSFKRLKERAQQRGAAKAAETVDAEARGAGFTGLGDALKTLRSIRDRNQPDTPAGEAPTMANSNQQRTLSEKTRAKIKGLKRSHAEQIALKDAEIAKIKAQNADSARQATAARAEADLRAKLSAAGVVEDELEYASELFQRELRGKTPDEVKTIVAGQSDWITKLKEKRPVLFQPVTKPATTGPAAQTTPATTVAAAESAIAGAVAGINQTTVAQRRTEVAKLKPNEVEARVNALARGQVGRVGVTGSRGEPGQGQ